MIIKVKLNQRHKQTEQELQGYWKCDLWDPIEYPLYNERLNIEEFIEKNVKGITEAELLKIDDRELLNLYSECIN